jgi:tetratricopeptide (TPR) repeat protein
VEDEELLADLERLVTRDEESAKETRDHLLQTIRQHAAQYLQGNQYWKSISLLDRARKLIAPMTDLDRTMALLLSGKADLVLYWANGLQIAPPADLLTLVEADLREAIDVDSTVADPYWDLAVINARYHADYAMAAQYLQAARARGYVHPMMARLEAMIEAEPPSEPVPDTDETRLRHLVLRLAVQAVGPMYSALSQEEESEGLAASSVEEESGDPSGERARPMAPLTFGDYLGQAKAIAANDSLSEDQYLRILDDTEVLTGDASEYVADLLRRVAEFAGGELFLTRATDIHLGRLRDGAFALVWNRKEGDEWITPSRKAAQRGLKIIEESRATVDPDLHADLLIAKGQALYYEDERYAAEAIRCYHEALRLKRQADNAPDVERMKGVLWEKVDDRVGRALVSLQIGGFGEALEVLKVCAEAAVDLDDPPRAMSVRLYLASVMYQVGQYDEAEQTLREILESSPPKKIARRAQAQLADVYSVTSRPREAAEIQRELLDGGGMDDDSGTATLWSNYSNSLRLLNDFGGARTALEKAWDLLPPEQKQKTETGQPIADRGARIKTMLAQLDSETGHHDEALKHLRAAEALNPIPHGVSSMHFYRIKARCLMATGKFAEAGQCLDTAIHNLKYLLSKGPSFPSWQSLLQEWAPLDAMAVHTYIESELDNRFENALLHAESAKGRMSAWIENWLAPNSAERALTRDRQVEALEIARQWLGERPSRRIVSLFGSIDGLGMFDVDEDGQVTGAWLDDFDYDLLAQDVYEPWERLVEQALSGGDPDTLALAGSQTEYLLDLVGTWLWRAQPSLADGGTDLVIIPHRLFRSLPLAHARLPTGRRLSDLFERVVSSPSLGDLGRKLEASANGMPQGNVIALADADRSLPFARCEAVLSGAGENAITGGTVTTNAVTKAFEGGGILLLSLHGDFDEQDPFQSKIFTADGDLSLHQLLAGQTPINSRIVVLGVCEAGRSQRSGSDELFGFPAMFLQGGAEVVVAPAWRVDDFTSFLFIGKMFDAIKQDVDIFHAVRDTARWLRELTAKASLEQTDYLISKLRDCGEQGQAAVEALKPKLESQTAWLETLRPTEKPFRSPLDWAAFQITGVPPAGPPA